MTRTTTFPANSAKDTFLDPSSSWRLWSWRLPSPPRHSVERRLVAARRPGSTVSSPARSSILTLTGRERRGDKTVRKYTEPEIKIYNLDISYELLISIVKLRESTTTIA